MATSIITQKWLPLPLLPPQDIDMVDGGFLLGSPPELRGTPVLWGPGIMYTDDTVTVRVLLVSPTLLQDGV